MKNAVIRVIALILYTGLMVEKTPAQPIHVSSEDVQKNIEKLVKKSYWEDALEISLNSGTNGARIIIEDPLFKTIKQYIKALPEGCHLEPTNFQCAYDLPDIPINDINYSTILFQWSNRYGGSLEIQIVFEDEKPETSGLLQVDLSDIRIHFFIIPEKKFSSSAVTWTGEVDMSFKYNSPASIIESFFDAFIKDEVKSSIKKTLLPAWKKLLAEQKTFINSFIFDVWTPIYSIEINQKEAVFSTKRPPKPTERELIVIFDSIHINYDEDDSGSGELYFTAWIHGLSNGKSAQFDKNTGDTIFLGGDRWKRVLYLDPENENQQLRLQLSGKDHDYFIREKSGLVDLLFSGGKEERLGATIDGNMHTATSDNGNFILDFIIREKPPR